MILRTTVGQFVNFSYINESQVLKGPFAGFPELSGPNMGHYLDHFRPLGLPSNLP